MRKYAGDKNGVKSLGSTSKNQSYQGFQRFECNRVRFKGRTSCSAVLKEIILSSENGHKIPEVQRFRDFLSFAYGVPRPAGNAAAHENTERKKEWSDHDEYIQHMYSNYHCGILNRYAADWILFYQKEQFNLGFLFGRPEPGASGDRHERLGVGYVQLSFDGTARSCLSFRCGRRRLDGHRPCGRYLFKLAIDF